jgi:hypothetical protein
MRIARSGFAPLRVMVHWLPRIADIDQSPLPGDLRSTVIAAGKELSHDLPPAVHRIN